MGTAAIPAAQMPNRISTISGRFSLMTATRALAGHLARIAPAMLRARRRVSAKLATGLVPEKTAVCRGNRVAGRSRHVNTFMALHDLFATGSSMHHLGREREDGIGKSV
jgi:hypothetical protein